MFCSQGVRDVVFWGAHWKLILLWWCSALSGWVMSSCQMLMETWCRYDCVPLSDCAWSRLLRWPWKFDVATTMFHSQVVRDLVFSGAHRNSCYYHHVPLSGSAWSRFSRCSSKSDVAAIVFPSQAVRDVFFWGAHRNLMLLRLCSTLRLCVMSSFEMPIEIWRCYHRVPLSASAWCRLFRCSLKSDVTTTMFRSQEVHHLVFWGAHRNWCCYNSIPFSGSAWCRLLRCSSKSNVATTVSRSQLVRDLVFWDADRNLMLLPPCSALRKYVISSFEVLIAIWYCYHYVLLSACVWCPLFRCSSKSDFATTTFRSQKVRDLIFFRCSSKTDVATTIFCSQGVRDVVFSGGHRNLMLLLPCFALSLCVISSFHVFIEMWCCYHYVPLSAGAWSHLFRCSSKSDVATTVFHSQAVRDVFFWGAHRKLMLLPPCSTLSECVISSFEVPIKIWCCYNCVPLLDCAWSRLLRCSSKSDVAKTPFHSQGVRDVVFWGAYRHLMWLKLFYALRQYVISSFEVVIELWCCYHHVPLSGSAWCRLLRCSWKSHLATIVFRSQMVIDLVFWDPHRNLMLLPPCSALRRWLISSFEIPIEIWCCYHHVPLSACAWSSLFRCSSKSDLLTTCSALRKCVILSFDSLIKIWCC